MYDACWSHGWCLLIPCMMLVDHMDDASSSIFKHLQVSSSVFKLYDALMLYDALWHFMDPFVTSIVFLTCSPLMNITYSEQASSSSIDGQKCDCLMWESVRVVTKISSNAHICHPAHSLTLIKIASSLFLVHFAIVRRIMIISVVGISLWCYRCVNDGGRMRVMKCYKGISVVSWTSWM